MAGGPLETKRTVLTRHEVQRTDTHVYFQYEGDEDLYRVGYYLPMVDYINLGEPNQITAVVTAGVEGMTNDLLDEGTWSEPVPYEGPKDFLDKIHSIQAMSGCTEVFFTNGAVVCSAGPVTLTEAEIVPSLRFEE